MNDITLGQVATAIAIVTAFWVFGEKIVSSISKMFDKKLEPIKKDISMLSDVTYQMLDHMATNNNTGGMKEVLNKYNEYGRHH